MGESRSGQGIVIGETRAGQVLIRHPRAGASLPTGRPERSMRTIPPKTGIGRVDAF